jgi:hypothetical protein
MIEFRELPKRYGAAVTVSRRGGIGWVWRASPWRQRMRPYALATSMTMGSG